MLSSKADPYQVLGVSPDADEEEIRSAYRNLARQHHPDASGDPETAEAFCRATEAYEQLRERAAQSTGQGQPVRVEVRVGPRPRTEAEPLIPPRERPHGRWGRVTAEPLIPPRPGVERLCERQRGEEPLVQHGSPRDWPDRERLGGTRAVRDPRGRLLCGHALLPWLLRLLDDL